MAARTAMSSDLYAEGHFEVEAWNASLGEEGQVWIHAKPIVTS